MRSNHWWTVLLLVFLAIPVSRIQAANKCEITDTTPPSGGSTGDVSIKGRVYPDEGWNPADYLNVVQLWKEGSDIISIYEVELVYDACNGYYTFEATASGIAAGTYNVTAEAEFLDDCCGQQFIRSDPGTVSPKS